jgi:hypothetical protein
LYSTPFTEAYSEKTLRVKLVPFEKNVCSLAHDPQMKRPKLRLMKRKREDSRRRKQYILPCINKYCFPWGLCKPCSVTLSYIKRILFKKSLLQESLWHSILPKDRSERKNIRS